MILTYSEFMLMVASLVKSKHKVLLFFGSKKEEISKKRKTKR